MLKVIKHLEMFADMCGGCPRNVHGEEFLCNENVFRYVLLLL